MGRHLTIPGRRPTSDVSPAVVLVGLAALIAWVWIALDWSGIAQFWDLPGPREALVGPNAAIAGLAFITVPMVLWSIFVDKVHLRPSTGIDWSLARTRKPGLEASLTKIAGLWATWAILVALYCLCRW